MFLFIPPVKNIILVTYFALKTSLGCLLLTFHVTLGFVSLLACGGLCLLPLSPCGCCLLCCFLLKHGPVKCVVILVVQGPKKDPVTVNRYQNRGKEIVKVYLKKFEAGRKINKNVIASLITQKFRFKVIASAFEQRVGLMCNIDKYLKRMRNSWRRYM